MEDVYVAYQRRSDAINKHIQFEIVVSLTPVFYKRKTGDKEIGDLKSITRKTKKTDLTITLTYLARYGHIGTLQFLQNAIDNPEVKEDKKRFYLRMLGIIEKCGFGRLMTLAMSRREQVYSRYEERGRIVFTSLSFKGRSRITRPIVAKSTKEKSRIQHFVEISWDWTETIGNRKKSDTMCIPVKYNAKYHRNLKRYNNGTDTFYTIVVRGKDIRVVLTRNGKRYIPVNDIEENKIVGGDVNQKHNLLILSDGYSIDHDRELIDELEKELLKIDKNREDFNKKQKILIEKEKEKVKISDVKFVKTKKVVYKLSRKEHRIIESLSRRNTHDQESKIACILRHMVSLGYNHLVLEDLDGFIGSITYGKNEAGVNTGRIGKALRLSSIKDIVLHMAPHYGVSVSLVHKEYSSKQCPECDCIDDLNRTDQENFVCVACGYSDNADHNASVNLKIRLTSTVLRGKLLRQMDTGYSAFLPKNLPRWQVKDTLEKYRHGADHIDPLGNLIMPKVSRNSDHKVLVGLQ
jgi:transposase